MAGMEFRPRPALIEGTRHAGGWVVAGRLYLPAMLISRDTVQSFGVLKLQDIVADHLPSGVDLLLLGTGARLERPPAALLELGRRQAMQIEAMDSSAAARTFNLLVQEDRAVAALLL